MAVGPKRLHRFRCLHDGHVTNEGLFWRDILLQQIINGLVLGSMYALIALATMVYGIIQLINFAHGEVLMIGARSQAGAVLA